MFVVNADSVYIICRNCSLNHILFSGTSLYLHCFVEHREADQDLSFTLTIIRKKNPRVEG